MELFSWRVWLNFLALLPATGLTMATIAVAFLRFYDEQDFSFLGLITQPRLWSNRLTVAAFMVALVNFGVEWNRRNRETDRLAAEEHRRVEEEQRRVEEEQRRIRTENRRDEEEQRSAEERERAARRARVQNRWILLQIRYLLDPSAQTQTAMIDLLQFLQDYGEL